MSLENLPVEWSIQKFEKVVFKIVGGGTPSKNNPEYYQGVIPWMSVKDMNKNILEDTVDHITQEAINNSATNLIPKGTPIIATRMSLGKVVVANFDSAINQDLKAIFLGEYIDNKFFIYWYRSQSKQIESLGTGTTVKGIRLEVINNLDFPLAPLAEQQEIVRQLDLMLAQVEQIKARLDTIPTILKKFRQSVLADAVSGNLLDDEVDSSIYSVKDIFEITSGIAFKKSAYTEKGHKLLQIANVSHGKTKWETLNFVSEQNAKQFDSCVLKSGDIVVALNRPITHDLLKIAKITEQDLPAILYQRVACLRVKENEVSDSEFLFLSMQATSFRKAIEAKLRGSDQPYLNTSDLGNLTINLFPLNEQTLILDKVRNLLSKVNQIEISVQLAQKRVNLLTQSILAKAFSGELTAEWREQHQELITGINSAESLLAKIQAERETSKPVKKVKKAKAV